MPTILHIIEQLSGAGPTRSLLALAKYQWKLALGNKHRAVILRPPIYPVAQLRAKQAGIEIIAAPDPQTFQDEMLRADIVHLHFWNTPALYEWLRQDKPAMRLLIKACVLGKYPPQILTHKLLSFVDAFVLGSPESLHLDNVSSHTQKAHVIFSVPDFERIANLIPQPHDLFNIGYVGTLNFNKLHPQFVQMNTEINIPTKNFIWCGNPAQSVITQIEAANLTKYVQLPGYVENLRNVLEVLDVFGYPLRDDTYATSEISLQEAMWSGIPPVVFPVGGIPALVKHEQTGLVVHSSDDYVHAIEQLHSNPDLRHRLGKQAQTFAMDTFNSETSARQFDLVYQQMMAQPKHHLEWQTNPANTPSLYFIEALGYAADHFMLSIHADNSVEQAIADEQIANASTLLAHGEGGIIQYRNSYPGDRYLRYWTALILLKQKRFEAALQELKSIAGKIDLTGRPYLQQYPDMIKQLV